MEEKHLKYNKSTLVNYLETIHSSFPDIINFNIKLHYVNYN
jgi:hypothetical protein